MAGGGEDGVDIERSVVVTNVVLVEQGTFCPPTCCTQGTDAGADTFPLNAVPDRTPSGFQAGSLHGLA